MGGQRAASLSSRSRTDRPLDLVGRLAHSPKCAAGLQRPHQEGQAPSVHDPDTELPEAADITPANVNDVSFASSLAITPGATYVFDKSYCSFALWTRIHNNQAIFITRAKTNAALEHVCPCGLDPATILESNVEACEIVRCTSQKAARASLDFLMRRITVRREDGRHMHIPTNDLVRLARDVAALYRRRWRIELMFR